MSLNDLVTSFVTDATEHGGLKVTSDQARTLCASLLTKRFLILTGLSGSGKTKLAQAFARWLTTPVVDSGVGFQQGQEVPSERATYYVRAVDTLSVEFWNEPAQDEATVVTLPLAMIREWAHYIRENQLPRTTQARVIREAVKPNSRYSSQLHSFETHLKAAAFALIESKPSTTTAHALLPVGADWTGSEHILGYPDGLDPTRFVSTSALDLILSARDNTYSPHFLILDEMNLSHVESYFADVLSALESNESIRLHGDAQRTANGRTVPSVLDRLPDNLFVIGTVNIDETTYMFSPKVLDRANVIEFRVDAREMQDFLGGVRPVRLDAMAGRGEKYGRLLLDTARHNAQLQGSLANLVKDELMYFFDALARHGMEFGFRSAHDSMRFAHMYLDCGGSDEALDEVARAALDRIIIQKLLPKLNGSRTRLSPVLRHLWHLCVEWESSSRLGDTAWQSAEPKDSVPESARYPRSAQKIARMWRQLQENGFTSFAEA